MVLVRYSPSREIESWQRQMNRAFNSIMTTGEGNFNSSIAFIPAVEMNETPDAIHLKLEVPGLSAEDLDVQVTQAAVSICGERKSESKTEENGVTRSEFRYGSFQRVIPLPARIQNDLVEAEFNNGVIILSLPKTEQEKNKVVKVNLEQAAL